jgi:hypothetical protein
MARSQTFEQLLSRIKSEYVEMPGLRLTAKQAERLCGLREDECEKALRTLVDREFLALGPDSTYCRRTGLTGRAPSPLSARRA